MYLYALKIGILNLENFISTSFLGGGGGGSLGEF